MLELLIVADDFTGALDTGVQFARKGYSTLVVSHDWSIDEGALNTAQVVSVSAESRHLNAQEAYKRVTQTLERFKGRYRLLYKKTDSALRGNIGAELRAAMDAAGESAVYFVPAFPQIGRVTRDGVQYVDGVPVEESVFGEDKFEPVRDSYIPCVISQVGVDIAVVGTKGEIPYSEGRIVYIFDSETREDSARATELIKKRPEARLFAGCAGFGEFMPEFFIGSPSFEPLKDARFANALLVVSGSLNPITSRQIGAARDAGYPVHLLSLDTELTAGYADSESANRFVQQVADEVLDSGVAVLAVAGRECWDGMSEEDIELERKQVCEAIKRLVCRVTAALGSYDIAVFGGDTVVDIVNELYHGAVEPYSEITPGVVVSKVSDSASISHWLVSKSGGFGELDAVRTIAKRLKPDSERGAIL